MPKTSSTSCDQAIFVDRATDTSEFSYAVLAEAGRLRQRFQRGGCVQEAVRPVQMVMDLVLAQDPPQMVLVRDEGAVQEFTAASPDPAFSDRVHPGRPDVAAHGPDPGVGEDGVEGGGPLFPDVGEDGPRRKIIDSAFKMTEQLAGSWNQVADKILKATSDALAQFKKATGSPE